MIADFVFIVFIVKVEIVSHDGHAYGKCCLLGQLLCVEILIGNKT